MSYFEVYSTQEETFTREGTPTATCTYRGPWADRHSFVIDILAGPGAAYPNWPAGLWAPRATSAKIKPLGDLISSGGDVVYENALVTVGFKFGKVEQADDGTIFSITTSPFSEFITLNPDYFRWGSEKGDPLENEEAPGLLVKGTRYSITYYKVATVPPRVEDLVGSVNANSFRDPRGRVHESETLLYSEPKISQSQLSDGSVESSVTLNLVSKPEGWNKFYRTNKLRYERMWSVLDKRQWDSYPLEPFPKISSLST